VDPGNRTNVKGVKRPALSQPTSYGYDQITPRSLNAAFNWPGLPGRQLREVSDGAGAGEAARRSPEPDLWLKSRFSTTWRAFSAALPARALWVDGEEHERERRRSFTRKIGQLTVEGISLARKAPGDERPRAQGDGRATF